MKHCPLTVKSVLLSVALLLSSVSMSLAQLAPHYLVDSGNLIGYLHQSGLNVYGSNPSYITWNGGSSAARTECSSFVTLLWQHSFGWTPINFRSWMASTSPTAAKYHDTIVAQNRFSQINYVNQIQLGDVIAIKYPPGGTATGHLMLVSATPVIYAATAPLVKGTAQVIVSVIDSSASYHGPTDTRLQPGGTGQGIGQGVFRLYVNASGVIVGHTWSTYSNSVFYNQSQRHVVVGRLR